MYIYLTNGTVTLPKASAFPKNSQDNIVHVFVGNIKRDCSFSPSYFSGCLGKGLGQNFIQCCPERIQTFSDRDESNYIDQDFAGTETKSSVGRRRQG